MSFLYFDESIRDVGDFIVGALIISNADLSARILNIWRESGLDTKEFEYKSSVLKANNATSQLQRRALRRELMNTGLALTVTPRSDRRQLGSHCATLVRQLRDNWKLNRPPHDLYLDEGIPLSSDDIRLLHDCGVNAHPGQDSRLVAGLQLADHAAHALGGMLLEEIGLITKSVRAGENSGYDPDQMINLGFELWAGIRYALIGNNEFIPGLSSPEDEANPYFRVDGIGLFIAHTCSAELVAHARRRFGTNYLGCIH